MHGYNKHNGNKRRKNVEEDDEEEEEGKTKIKRICDNERQKRLYFFTQFPELVP